MKIGKQGKKPVKLKRSTTTAQKFGAILRIILLIAIFIGLIWSQNNLVITKDYLYKSDRLPKTFVGYNIVSVSDMHNTHVSALGNIKRCNPDLIIVSGGIVDDDGKYKQSTSDIKKMAEIAPTYCVLSIDDLKYKAEIESAIGKAVILNDSKVDIKSPQIDESTFIDKYVGSKIKGDAESGDEMASQYIEYTKQTLREDAEKYLSLSGFTANENSDIQLEKIYEVIGTDKEVFQIVIAHQLGMYESLSNADIDIVFSGETHGTDKINSSYTKGVYARYGTTLFLNGGVGNSEQFSNRLFNYPEIISVTLSDGTIRNENPLEKLLSHFISDVGTKFDDDGGFKEYRYTYSNNYYVE